MERGLGPSSGDRAREGASFPDHQECKWGHGGRAGETLFTGRAPAALHTEKVISPVAAEEGAGAMLVSYIIFMC